MDPEITQLIQLVHRLLKVVTMFQMLTKPEKFNMLTQKIRKPMSDF